MSKKPLLIVLSFMLCLTGCAKETDVNVPPEIRYGEDICDQCNMIISEARYAAAFYTKDGTAKKFDDIGDMLTYLAKHDEELAAVWVHDYESEAWLQADDAFFVMADGLYTPMAFGIVAFGDQDQAEDFATQKQGMVMAYEDVMSDFHASNEDHDQQ